MASVAHEPRPLRNVSRNQSLGIRASQSLYPGLTDSRQSPIRVRNAVFDQHEAIAPNGAVLLGFFLKPNRFAYGERFFTEKEER